MAQLRRLPPPRRLPAGPAAGTDPPASRRLPRRKRLQPIIDSHLQGHVRHDTTPLGAEDRHSRDSLARGGTCRESQRPCRRSLRTAPSLHSTPTGIVRLPIVGPASDNHLWHNRVPWMSDTSPTSSQHVASSAATEADQAGRYVDLRAGAFAAKGPGNHARTPRRLHHLSRRLHLRGWLAGFLGARGARSSPGWVSNRRSRT